MAGKPPAKSAGQSQAPPPPAEGPATAAAPAAPPEPAIAAVLAAPFDPTEVKFKPQSISGNRALAVPYIDARLVAERLDLAVGLANWQDAYDFRGDGSVICRLSVRLEGEWITKEDVGAPSEQPDEGDRQKGAVSDALKRAAVKYGIGRYLYRMRPQWVDWDPQNRRFVRPPSLAPLEAVPAPAGRARAAPAGAAPAAARSVWDRAGDFEERLVAEGLAQPGELAAYLVASLGEGWPGLEPARVAASCHELEARRRELAPVKPEHVGALKAALDRKGQRWEQVIARFGLHKTARPEALSVLQYKQALEMLGGLPDREGYHAA